MDTFTKEIRSCTEVLNKGGLILYPTETVWGIGCDATNEDAVQRVYDLKEQPKGKPFLTLVGSDAMLERYVEEVPEVAWDILDLSTKPTAIVFDHPRDLARGLVGPDNSLPIRVVTDKFCRYLINAFKKPIIFTPPLVSGAPIPNSFGEIKEPILKGVDYVVNLHREKWNAVSTSVIKLGNDGTVKVIRE